MNTQSKHPDKPGYTGAGYTPKAIAKKAKVRLQKLDTPEGEIEGVDLQNSFITKMSKFDKYNRNLLKVKKH